jgi:hypothetical protein
VLNRLFAVAALVFAVSVPAVAAVSSLKDDLKYGCSDTVLINRTIGAIRFQFGNNELQLNGTPAQRWIQLSGQKGLGGCFVQKFEVRFKEANGQPIHSALRFEAGCIFVDSLRHTLVVLDWNAVKAWEMKGGYDKVGLPTKDAFNPTENMLLVRPSTKSPSNSL